MPTLASKLEAEEALRREREARGPVPLHEKAIDGAKAVVAHVKPRTDALMTDLKNKGVCGHVGEFAKDLIRPMRRILDVGFSGFVGELKGMVSMNPKSPINGFVMWNLLAFWFGVAEMVVRMLLTIESVTAGVISILIGFLVAYFLFWTFVHSNDKWYQQKGIIFCVLLTIFYTFDAIFGILTIVKTIPSIIDLCKAIATAIMSLNAWKIYSETAGTDHSNPANALRLV